MRHGGEASKTSLDVGNACPTRAQDFVQIVVRVAHAALKRADVHVEQLLGHVPPGLQVGGQLVGSVALVVVLPNAPEQLLFALLVHRAHPGPASIPSTPGARPRPSPLGRRAAAAPSGPCPPGPRCRGAQPQSSGHAPAFDASSPRATSLPCASLREAEDQPRLQKATRVFRALRLSGFRGHAVLSEPLDVEGDGVGDAVHARSRVW